MDQTEFSLWEEYVNTRDIRLRNRLVTSYIETAHIVAHAYVKRSNYVFDPLISIEDIISYAYLGLIDSVERFDPTIGVKFQTYATRRITGCIIDEVRKVDWVSRNSRKKIKLVKRRVKELANTSQYIDHEAIAREFKLSLKEKYILDNNYMVPFELLANTLGECTI